MIGFGKSDRPATVDYSIKFFRQVILEFMKKVGIDDGKTSIVGHSLGGYFAAEVAIENRALAARLVLIERHVASWTYNFFVMTILYKCMFETKFWIQCSEI